MTKEKIPQIEVNRLYKIAEEFRKNITEEDKIEKIDQTDNFLYELDTMIKNGEIIIININAKMRLGKSTLAIALGQHIWQLLIKNKMRKPEEKFGMTNIDRDQQEHSKRMRDPNTRFTVRVVDESNALEEGGENSSTERALSKVFSDVQAGRYVHKVCCSPKETTDPNADILLSVIGIDKRNMITHAKLYYRYYEGGTEYTILLGYIRISVANIIQKWEKEAKKLFYKQKRTKEEEQKLQKIIKEDYYTEYITKKYEKMNMLTEEGIFRPRVLDYAEIIVNITDRLKKLTKMTSIINANLVRNYIKMECRKQKIPLSIVGEELATREALGLLDLHKSYNTLIRKKEKIKPILDELEKGEECEEMEQVIEMIKEIKNAIEIQEDEYRRYAEINKKYNTINKQEETTNELQTM